ncbi:unnamed protein product [Choristocarpus tenellus]
MARGFSQQEGVDYFSTFSPVVGFDVIRAVLATAANRNWVINSLDFTQAYLNALVHGDVWLQLPNGSFAKAARAIYGLKQLAMEWYKELKGTILAEGWSVSDFDACLYVKRSEDGRVAVLFHYMDDISLTGNYHEEIPRTKNNLLTRSKEYLITSNPGMDLTARRTDEDELDQKHKPYRTIQGKLMFLAGMTRPGLSNSVRELGRYAASPCDRHWKGLQYFL